MRKIFGVVGLAALCVTMGCSGEMDSTALADEADVGQVESALENGEHVVIFAFNQGSWRRSDYAGSATTNPTVTTGSFGASDDIPFIYKPNTINGATLIGSYGTSGARLGYFYLDKNNNMTWDDPAGVKFRSDAQSGDKPFVITAPLWTRVIGVCTAGAPGRMVGIKRGTTVYLDRDGDGVWAGLNHCDLSGTIGNAGDNPVAVPSPTDSSENILALTRASGSNVTWYHDTNRDLNWNEPPDWSSAVNAFGDGSQSFPVTSPGGIATKQTNGTTVFYDADRNGVWQATDMTYASAVPSSAWKLAGVGRYFLHP